MVNVRTPTATTPRSALPWLGLLAFQLERIRLGSLTVEMPDGTKRVFRGRSAGPSAEIRLVDPSIARRLVAGGSLALAEGYMDGAWDTPDLDAVLNLGMENIATGWGSDVPLLRGPVERLRHLLRDNNANGGSKRNIAAHYDLGNDFYALWLDKTMTYSAACLDATPERSLTPEELERAQRRKWDRMLELVQPGRGDHVLEIGCGWGGFAIHAAREAGCRVTGLTLSEEQAALARMRVEAEGLDDLVEIRLQDYRHVSGSFSSIVSIEMFEAVGMRWWPVYFGRLKELLGLHSAAALQTITITDEAFEEYRRSPDFIQHYVFPGGMLPSPERFRSSAEHSGLKVCQPRFFGHDYAETLRAWSASFESALPEVRALGFDERFIRMWRYYLSYCRTGFDYGRVDVMQVRLET